MTFKVFTHSFSNDYQLLQSMYSNILEARELTNTYDIEMIVASSMGAFIAMGCTDIPKVLINPCMLPSEQIKLRIAPSITITELTKYRDYETSLVVSDNERLQTYGLFSTDDEFFSYKRYFKSKYNPDKVYTMNDQHRISVTSIENELIPLIKKLFVFEKHVS